MENQDIYQLDKLKKIILSWDPSLEYEKIESIKSDNSMIAYMYEGDIFACENKMFIDSLCSATLARVAETQLAVEERISALRY